MAESQFQNNQSAKLPHPSEKDMLWQKVEEALDQIRPAIEMDGGIVELSDIVDGVAYVEMRGACGSCPSSTITLKAGIERIILEQVPEIKAVEAV